jgi:hypothetical protein
MPVDSTHIQYDANANAWWRARDVFAGEDAVKAAGVRYLPRLDSQTDDEYAAYKERASFFNATARTADGFVGLIFRREPSFKLPDNSTGVGRAIATFFEDADLQGTSLPSYAKNVAGDVIGVGRAGTLVDWEDQVEQRAYVVHYAAEQIINWRTERVNGRNLLTLVVLKESGGQTSMAGDQKPDEFVRDAVEQIRVLRLVNDVSRRTATNTGVEGEHRGPEICGRDLETEGSRRTNEAKLNGRWLRLGFRCGWESLCH